MVKSPGVHIFRSFRSLNWHDFSGLGSLVADKHTKAIWIVSVAGQRSLGLSCNWSSLLKPLKLLPVGPDNDEDVECKNETNEARDDNAKVTVDQVSNDLDQIEHQADDGQNNPGHQQTGLFLPCTVDEHGSNDNVANADDKKDCHHGSCPC